MSDEPNSENENPDDSKGGGLLSKLMVWGVVFMMGAGTGVGAALMMSPEDSKQNGADVTLVSRMDIPEPDETLAFIEFKDVVVNLNDARYSRYVTCKFSMQVAASQKPAIEGLVEQNEAVLKNWLISHLGDKKLDDVRGKLGHNTLRREIHDKFNELLFTDGIERIQDILFQDFKVQ